MFDVFQCPPSSKVEDCKKLMFYYKILLLKFYFILWTSICLKYSDGFRILRQVQNVAISILFYHYGWGTGMARSSVLQRSAGQSHGKICTTELLKKNCNAKLPSMCLKNELKMKFSKGGMPVKREKQIAWHDFIKSHMKIKSAVFNSLWINEIFYQISMYFAHFPSFLTFF